MQSSNNTKMAHNSTNDDENDAQVVSKDSFIHEEYNDIVNDTNDAKETAQINTLVPTGLIQLYFLHRLPSLL